MEMMHTPGPWATRVYPRSRAWVVTTDVNDASQDVANVLGFRDSEANARLISAAPDLLAAAKAKLADCDECKDAALMPGEVCSDECAALVAAIAKAEGRDE